MVAMTVFRLPCEVLERAGRIPDENRLRLQTHEAPHPNRVLCRWQHRRKVIVPSRRMNYPRRQQYRRLSRAGGAAAGSAALALAGLTIAGAGAGLLAGLLLLTAVGLGLNARRWLGLAGRSRIGARSEDAVRRALAPLQAEGWRLRHSLPWQGRGDIDSVAVSPTGIAVVIETKYQVVRPAPSRSGARAGGLAVTAPAKMGAQRRAWSPVSRPCAWSRAR